MNALETLYLDFLACRAKALGRAQNAWGPAAAVSFVMTPDQTLFTVSSGEPFAPRFYGAGATWEEAFADAALPLSAPEIVFWGKPARASAPVLPKDLGPSGFGGAQPT